MFSLSSYFCLSYVCSPTLHGFHSPSKVSFGSWYYSILILLGLWHITTQIFHLFRFEISLEVFRSTGVLYGCGCIMPRFVPVGMLSAFYFLPHAGCPQSGHSHVLCSDSQCQVCASDHWSSFSQAQFPLKTQSFAPHVVDLWWNNFGKGEGERWGGREGEREWGDDLIEYRKGRKKKAKNPALKILQEIVNPSVLAANYNTNVQKSLGSKVLNACWSVLAFASAAGKVRITSQLHLSFDIPELVCEQ